MLPVLFLSAALLSASVSVPAPGPCALVDLRDVAAAQKTRIVGTKESRATGPLVERRDCFYQADPVAQSVSLDWTVDSAPGGARQRWEETFHGGHAKGRRGERDEDEERPKAPPQPVAGVGDEAFWVGNPASGALYALAGSSFVRVSVGGPGTGDEKRERARAIALRAAETIRGRPGRNGAAPADHAPPHDLR